jgi:coproporphyrinogen III oxidase-like Fe-S oxidoreductase
MGLLAMPKLNLSALERAALFTLLRRRSLFRWEQEALTDDIISRLEEKGLIAREGERWQITEKGARQITAQR